LSVTAAPQTPQKTAHDGVYTDAQATRGQQFYRRLCSKCHLSDLSGGEDAGGVFGETPPPLRGEAFTERWKNRTLDDLFTFARSSMPLDAPGALEPQIYIDVVSYVLKMNGMPAGAAELPPDSGALKQIALIGPQ
jgi:cytochrome c